MPRPVVPILRDPRNRSVTLSRTRLYEGMTWALADTTRREVDVPRASSPSISLNSTARSIPTPFAMTGTQPGAVESLSAAVRNLADVTAGAKETVETMNRVAHRVENIVEELERPLKALGPGMDRIAKVLDDPIMSTVPDAINQVRRDLLPV